MLSYRRKIKSIRELIIHRSYMMHFHISGAAIPVLQDLEMNGVRPI